ncbi:VOC family protein [Paenibacillus sp. YIM B09110]|uniref:VOC family protein n=1 Tax=Paenibacillus sp. YIM B09110 TaxID=3126102 RepID=UPI00301B7EAB
MGSLKPYIISEDARSQAAFYAQSLGGEIVSVATHGDLMGAEHELKDKVMHLCVMVAGGHAIFMADAIEPFTRGTGLSLALEFYSEQEAGDAFGKLAVGGNVKHPIERQPFGIYYGELTDKYGVSWMITAASN